MQIDPETSAAWMSEFAQQHRRGKHVLLYGNITDQFLFNAQYLLLLDFPRLLPERRRIRPDWSI